MLKEDEMLKELTQIRELLAAKPAPPPSPPKGLWFSVYRSYITHEGRKRNQE